MLGRLTPLVKNLLIINILIYVIPSFLDWDLGEIFGLRYINADSFKVFQFITYMFVHAGFWHLFSNMFGLFIFGPMIESYLGSQRFFVYYIISGVGAGLLYGVVNFVEMRQLEQAAYTYKQYPNPDDFSLFVTEHASYAFKAWYDFIDQYGDNPNSQSYVEESIKRVDYLVERQANVPMVGASGAVFAILLAFAFLFPNLQLFLLFPPMPVKAKYLVGFYAVYSLFSAIQPVEGDNVAHWAHLGGMLIGFIILKMWNIKSGFN